MRGDDRDERMDAALRSYADPGEIPETRLVVARVMGSARSSELQRKALWVWGAAGLAAMLAVGVVWMMPSSRVPEIAWTPKAPGVARVEVPLGEPRVDAESASVRSRAAVGARGMRTAAAKQLPKLDSFPTPRPLSPEEEALVSFARQAPPGVKKAVIEDQQHWDQPIIVADLRDPSLQAGGHQDQ
jgi:hypothetical protein